ncbi:MAG TPA: hypothetical protein VNW92_18100 [Polyangiaceae bacterium]|nr:hypothetical protein [Polyangiaceae bacterium]
MTDEEREHEDLQRLFDATAEEPSGPTLTKLAARAADVPARRKSRFLSRWAWGPAFAGAALALGGLFALRAATHRLPPQREPELCSATAAPNEAVAVASGSAHEMHAGAPRAPLADEANDNTELLGDADEGARFDVSGPQTDRDLDAWLAATKELSGGT